MINNRLVTRLRPRLTTRGRVFFGTVTVLAILAGCGLITAASAEPAARSAAVPHRVLWGASFGNPAPWKWNPIRRFEHMAGKGVSLVSFGRPFEHCGRGRCWFYSFPRHVMQKIRRHGGIPVVNWGSASAPMRLTDPRFRDSRIADGHFDRYIKRFARAAKRWGHPFFIRFDWEMNGNWFPWGIGVNGNHPRAFVRAWQHVHHIFREVGATNASWVWCPNTGHRRGLSSIYPGKGYVDWTCLDGYNWGTTGPGSPGALRGGFEQFSTIFSPDYQMIIRHVAPSKPMMLGEVGSNDHGGSESRWINRMFAELPWEFPRIQGLLWYQARSVWGFTLHDHTAAARAFSAGIKESRYTANIFCHIGGLSASRLVALPAARCKN